MPSFKYCPYAAGAAGGATCLPCAAILETGRGVRPGGNDRLSRSRSSVVSSLIEAALGLRPYQVCDCSLCCDRLQQRLVPQHVHLCSRVALGLRSQPAAAAGLSGWVCSGQPKLLGFKGGGNTFVQLYVHKSCLQLG